MVNLTFCRLDVSYPINPDNSEAHHSSISIFHFPSAGRSFMLEFLFWSFKNHLIRCFPNCFPVFLVICCSDFVSRRDLAFADPEGRSVDFVDLGPWSDLLDALVSRWIFSNNRRRPFRLRPFYLLNFLGSFDWFGRFCLLLCLCIILTWNPIDYHIFRLLLVVHQRIYCFCISSLWL